MSDEAWPTPQQPSREPLPRVEDLPIAEQGYEPESVRAAFDAFYRHAAQLDAALRTLEAVDSFHRQAAALRADLRVLRTGGWTQQAWPTTPAYGYGMRSPREGISPAVWRIAGEVAFLIGVSVLLGVAKLSWWVIVLVMAVAFVMVALIEWAAARDFEFVRSESTPLHPVVEVGTPAPRTEEEESFGWTAFEEAQEPSDAMTMIGAPPGTEEDAEEKSPAEPVAEAAAAAPEEAPAEPVADLSPDEEPEAIDEPARESRRRWWRRSQRAEADEPGAEASAGPRHVRVLALDDDSDDASRIDPWEQGFDEADIAADAEELNEDTHEGEPALAAELDESERHR
jgi:hypothetical protein